MINELLNIFDTYGSELLTGLYETLMMVTISSLISLLIGLPLGIVVSLTRKGELYYKPVTNTVLSVVINIIRSIPYMLFIIILIPATRVIMGTLTGSYTAFGMQASIIPLSIIGISLMARLIEQSVLQLNPLLFQTAKSLAASPVQTIRFFVIPEIKGSIILSFSSLYITLISYSTIMGIIAGGGLGDLAIRIGYQKYETTFMLVVIIIIILISQSVQMLLNYWATKINQKGK